MKKKALAIAAVVTVSAVFLAGGFYANSDQLQGRFGNVMPSFKDSEGIKSGPDLSDRNFGMDVDLSAGLVYFDLTNMINSSAELDLDSDEKVIIGHTMLDFTDTFEDKYSGELVDVQFSNIAAFSSDTGAAVVNLSYLTNYEMTGFGYDLVATNTYSSNNSYIAEDVDPSEGMYTVEFWINPSKINMDRFTGDLGEEMYLSVYDLYMRLDSETFTYLTSATSADTSARFSLSDTDLRTNGEEAYKSLMTFTIE